MKTSSPTVLQRAVTVLRRFFLEWRFLRGGGVAPDRVSSLEAGRYEEVEEVCLRRGQRSRKMVRRLVSEG